MVSEWNSKIPKRPRAVAFRASTALLLLAFAGLLLHLSGIDASLSRISGVSAWLLVSMAPLWALCGCLAATVYLVLTVWRPSYSAAQHLLEMVAGAALIVLLRPVF